MSKTRKRDLSEFDKLTAAAAPWEDRLAVIRDHFNSADQLDWAEAFRVDIELMGRIIRDLIGIKGSGKGRSGPRRSPDYEDGMRELRSLFGMDFSTLSFPDALRALAINEGPTEVADRSGIAVRRVTRLMHGDERPSAAEVRRIALGYGKRPEYFAEYRTLFIAARFAAALDSNPEWGLDIFQQMNRRAK